MQANAPTAPPLLDVRGVTLQHKTRQHLVMTTYRVDFQVYPSERYILSGSSGYGKSALPKTIGNHLTFTEGEIHLKGQPMMKPRPDRMMVFQEFNQLLPWKTVKKNMLLPLLSMGKLSVHEAEERTLYYINKVNLTKFADHHPHILSDGMKQYVAIAHGMAMEPDVLLVDESFATPDVFTCRKMQDELLQLWDETRFTMPFVMYSIPEAIRCGSRILILSLHPGQVCAELPSLVRDDDDPERLKALEIEIHDMLLARVAEGTHTD